MSFWLILFLCLCSELNTLYYCRTCNRPYVQVTSTVYLSVKPTFFAYTCQDHSVKLLTLETTAGQGPWNSTIYISVKDTFFV